jgi:hypothetical protein
MASPSSEQVAWASKFLNVPEAVLANPDGGAGAGDPAAQNPPEKLDGGSQTKGFSPSDIIPGISDFVKDVVDDVLEAILGPLKFTCKITNSSGQTLERESINTDSGEFELEPERSIGSDKDSEFSAINKSVLNGPILKEAHTAGVVLTVRYAIGNDKTAWVLNATSPRVGPAHAEASIEGPSKDKFETDQNPTVGGRAEEKFCRFVLRPKGGTAPTPTPPGPGPATETNASCTINVTNNTGSVITLSKQGHDRGDFMTFPAQSVQPGGSTSFVSVRTPNQKDKEQGCKGFVLWSVGSPPVCSWRCEWDNPEGQKNTAASTLDPQSAGFQSLDQIGQGDENVPVAFTLSGGGGVKPNPTPAGATNCEISLNNGTQFLLKLADAKHSSGDFSSPPPKEIPANGAATCADGGPQGCAGSLIYQIISPAEGANAGAPVGTWKLEWSNPPGASNSADSSVDPQSAGLQSMTTVGAGDDKVAVSFSLFGGQSPQPQPEKEPDFKAPLDKTRQPTLREGDKSADDWVEYLQDLLGIKITGAFDAATKQAVIDFQTAQHKKDPSFVIDGIVGNQTWAALREDPPEKASTDGRKPHTFVQEGEQARFYREQNTCGYLAQSDSLFIDIVSVGTEGQIDNEDVVVRVTPPGTNAQAHTLKLKIGKGRPVPEGFVHVPVIPNFKQTYGKDVPDAPVDQYLIEAYFDNNKTLGNDSIKVHPVIV